MKKILITLVLVLILSGCSSMNQNNLDLSSSNVTIEPPISNEKNGGISLNESYSPSEEQDKTFPEFELEAIDLYFPENQYVLNVENFTNHSNDEYIRYLFSLLSSSNLKSITNIPYSDYNGFCCATDLCSDVLFNIFFTATSEQCDSYLQENTGKYIIPKKDIQSVLDKYFTDYNLDIYNLSYNFEYINAGEYIVSPGFDSIIQTFHGGYEITSIDDNSDGISCVLSFVHIYPPIFLQQKSTSMRCFEMFFIRIFQRFLKGNLSGCNETYRYHHNNYVVYPF